MEKEFKIKRVRDKIKYLKSYLPTLTTKFPSIYQILSTGIHELTDDECNQNFGTLKLAIEATINERIITKQKEKDRSELEKNLGKINQNQK